MFNFNVPSSFYNVRRRCQIKSILLFDVDSSRLPYSTATENVTYVYTLIYPIQHIMNKTLFRQCFIMISEQHTSFSCKLLYITITTMEDTTSIYASLLVMV